MSLLFLIRYSFTLVTGNNFTSIQDITTLDIAGGLLLLFARIAPDGDMSCHFSWNELVQRHSLEGLEIFFRSRPELLFSPTSPLRMNARLGRTIIHDLCLSEICDKGEDVYSLLLQIYPEHVLASITATDVDGFLPSHIAAQCGKVILLNSIAGLVPESLISKSSIGRTPLHFAAQGGHTKLCELILDNFPKAADIVDNDNRTALHLAVFSGNLSTTKLLFLCSQPLIRALTSSGRVSCLFVAAEYGHKDICNFLLHEAPDVSLVANSMGAYPLEIAVCKGYTDIVQQFLTRVPQCAALHNETNKRYPIHFAALSKSFEIAKLVFDAFPDAATMRDNDGYLPLHMAAQTGNKDIFELLLKEEPDSIYCTVLSNNRTVVHFAAQSGHTHIIDLIIAHHERTIAAGRAVKMSLEDLFQTKSSDEFGVLPIHIAAFNGHAEVVRRLLYSHYHGELSCGLSARMPNSYGWLPLHSAVFGQQTFLREELLRLLLAANPLAVSTSNRDGITPYQAYKLACDKLEGVDEGAVAMVHQSAGAGTSPATATVATVAVDAPADTATTTDTTATAATTTATAATTAIDAATTPTAATVATTTAATADTTTAIDAATTPTAATVATATATTATATTAADTPPAAATTATTNATTTNAPATATTTSSTTTTTPTTPNAATAAASPLNRGRASTRGSDGREIRVMADMKRKSVLRLFLLADPQQDASLLRELNWYFRRTVFLVTAAGLTATRMTTTTTSAAAAEETITNTTSGNNCNRSAEVGGCDYEHAASKSKSSRESGLSVQYVSASTAEAEAEEGAIVGLEADEYAVIEHPRHRPDAAPPLPFSEIIKSAFLTGSYLHSQQSYIEEATASTIIITGEENVVAYLSVIVPDPSNILARLWYRAPDTWKYLASFL